MSDKITTNEDLITTLNSEDTPQLTLGQDSNLTNATPAFTLASVGDAQPTVKYIDEKGVEQTVTTTYTLINENSAKVVSWSAGYYVVGADYDGNGVINAADATYALEHSQSTTFTISGGAWVSGDVRLILVDGFTLTTNGASHNAGVTVTGGTNSFTVYGQEGCTGTLNATGGGDGGAGIGGSYGNGGSNITINGGIVNATGGYESAGIGGGEDGSGTNITINGGIVTAIGADDGELDAGGAGIGGGGSSAGDGSNITITGGTVTAKGGGLAAGIGGGVAGTGSNITISGGIVNATGGASYTGDSGGAGIGGGENRSGTNITISGGTVTAIGGDYAAGIGGGSDGTGSEIAISGGVVTAIGSAHAAGIGGGILGDGSNITITGGTVTATGGVDLEGGTNCGSGIGNGGWGESSNIFVDSALTLKADTSTNPPTTEIAHDSSTDVAASLTGKRFATAVEPSGSPVITTRVIVKSNTVSTNPYDLGTGSTYTCPPYSSGGGAVNVNANNYATGSDLTFTGNISTNGSGGAIASTGFVTMTSGTFSNNSAKSRGGAVYSDSPYGGVGVFNATDVLFSGNTASGTLSSDGGGAVYNCNTATFNATGSTFSNNVAQYGGAVFNYNSATFNATSSTFSNNTASYDGGAVFNRDGVFTATFSTFSNNTATSTEKSDRYGGAVENLYSKSTFTAISCTFDANTVMSETNGLGGAVYNSGTFGATNSTFSNNIMEGGTTGRGAVYNGKVFTATNSTFSNNVAKGGTAGEGGAVYNYSSSTFTATSSTFSNNVAKGGTAGIGGAVYNYSKSYVTNSTFSGNTATTKGGAVYNQGTMFSATSVTFSGNTATTEGGAVYNYTKKVVTLSDVVFDGNTATTGGAVWNGGMVNFTGDVTLKTNSDTIYNAGTGTLNWDITGGKSQYGSVSNYSLITNDGGTLAITVSATAGAQENGTYTLAYNAASAASQTFTLMGGGSTATITVGGANVTYNSLTYTLAVDGSNNLVLTVSKPPITSKVVVDTTMGTKEAPYDLGNGDTYTVASESYKLVNGGAVNVASGAYATGTDLTFANCKAYSEDNNAMGGAIYNAPNGVITLKGATTTFSGNMATASANAYGGAIFNAGGGVITFESEAYFSSNKIIGNKTFGGAIYNIGTVNFKRAVTLATDSDTIYNSGTLSWDITGGTASYGYVNNYSLITNEGGKLAITVSATSGAQENGTYTLAYNAASAASQTFTLAGGSSTATITVDGTDVTYNGKNYKLAVDTSNANNLVLTVTTPPVHVYNASGAEITSGPYKTVADGFAATQTGYKVQLGEDSETLTEAVGLGGDFTVSGKSVTFNLNGNTVTGEGKAMTVASGATVILSGAGEMNNARIINSGTVTKSDATNLTFSGNTVTDTYGGALNNSGTFSATSVTFSGNVNTKTESNGVGGAVSNETGGVFSATNSLFSGNTTSQGYGGAVLNKKNAIFTVSGSTFSNNYGKSSGAVHNLGTFTATSVTFSNNTATGSGGAVYNTGLNGGAKMTLTSVTFTGNTTSGNGGAINNYAFLELTDVTFNANTSGFNGYGGALYNYYGTVTLSNVVFDGNGVKGAGKGGAIYNNALTGYGSGSVIVLKGNITLKTASDTIYNAGNATDKPQLVWDITGGATAGKYGYVNDFSRITNDGMLAITVGGSVAVGDTYTLAGNVESTIAASKQTFTLLGTGLTTAPTITIDGDSVSAGDFAYTLSVKDMTASGGTARDLVLTVKKAYAVHVYNGTTEVGEGYDTVKEGFAVAENGYTVKLTKTAPFGDNSFSAEKSVTFNLNGNTVTGTGKLMTVVTGVAVTLSGAGEMNNVRLVNNGTVTKSDAGILTFTGSTCTSSSSGAAMHNAGGTFNATSVMFSNNKSTRHGGAVNNEAGIFAVTNSTFSGNMASTNGGAVYNNGYSGYPRPTTFTAISSTFSGNSAANGGAVYSRVGATFAATSSTFSGNMASTHGGAVYNEAGTFTAISSTFSNNTATGGIGGAVYNSTNSVFTAIASTFTGNMAATYGGAVYNRAGSTFTATSSTFTGNMAATYGGAVINAGTFTATSSTFTGNTATSQGGAVYNCDAVTFIAIGSTFTGNTAGGNGGAVQNNNGKFIAIGSTFSNNVGLYGGAVFNSGPDTFDATSVTFSNNTATGGIGGAIYSNAKLNLSDVVFDGNVAAKKGGAVQNTGTVNFKGNVTLKTDTDIIYNKGTLNWDITGGTTTGKYGYVDRYDRITIESGTLAITVSATQATGTYTLAGNVETELDASKKTFTITGVTGTDDVKITVNGDSVKYNKLKYTLSVDASNNLVLDVKAGDVHVFDTTPAEIVTSPFETVKDGFDNALTGYKVQLGDTGETLTEAIALGGDFTVGGKSVTFNLNGNTVTGAGKVLKMNNGAALTLSGAGEMNKVQIQNYGGVLTKTDAGSLIFSNNTAMNGGAVLSTGTFTAVGSTFTGNSATSGGAVKNTGTFTATSSTFTGNTAGTQGGAVFSSDVIELTNSVFTGNTAVTDGGAVYSQKNTFNATSNTFSNNVASRGGASLNAGTFTALGNMFSGNMASTNGGAVYNSDTGLFTATSNTFSNNSAVETGGAVYNSNTFTAIGSTFTGNIAGMYGGAVFNASANPNAKTFGATNSLFSGNTAGQGGAVYNNTDATFTATGNTFTGNTATKDGGAVYNKSTFDATNSTFSGNMASTNGGAVVNAGTFSATSVTFSNNKASLNTSKGGAILNGIDSASTNSTFTATSSMFSGNSANNGGVMYNYGTFTATSSTFSTNSAANGGALFSVGTFTATSSTFSGNSASSSGGAVFNSGVFTATGSTFSGNSAVNGGAVYYNSGDMFTATSVTFSGNSVSTSGGAVYNTGGIFTATSSMFTGNRAASNGGALYNENNKTSIVTGSTFSGNTANNGGAVYNKAATFTATSVTFSGNSASSNGGAAYSLKGTATVINSTFSTNRAANGGAVHSSATGTFTATSSTFSGNMASTNGGAIYNGTNSVFTADGNTFSGNAANNGGAVYNFSTNSVFNATSSTFSGNSATYGGAVYNFTDGTFGATNSTFSGNTATDYGGAVYNKGTFTATSSTFSGNSAYGGGAVFNTGTISVTGSTFSNNMATNDGGAVFNNEAGTFIATGSTFSNNSSNMYGGAVFNNEAGTFIATGSTFSNNSSKMYGGAVYNTEGAFGATNSTFSGNTANNGGAVYNYTAGTFTATSSTFSNNSANMYGGAVNNAGTFTATSSTFSNNTATNKNFGYGGAVSNKGTFTATNSTFSNNVANVNGGALYNNTDATFTATSSTFSGNTANNGGAVYNNNAGTFTATSSMFSGNMASTNGGAVYNNSTATFTAIGSTFSNNTATGNGGALYNSEGSFGSTNSMFSGNTATNGGAVYNDKNVGKFGATFTATSSTFSSNTATSGGAVYNTDTFTATGSTFSNNSASNGGAVYNTDTFTATNSTFSNNTASSNGGAVYNKGTFTATSSTFSGNKAPDYGGAVYNEANSVFTATSSTFSNNVASGDGGALYNVGEGTFTATGSMFSNNSAYQGGAVYNVSEGTFTATSSTFSNNSASATGAAVENRGSFFATNVTFSGNTAVGVGGAIDNYGGTVTLSDVTFDGNKAAGNSGAIYNAADGVVNFTGKVTLKTNTDIIYSKGTLSWDITGGTASYGYVSDYSLITNDGGTLYITVKDDQSTGTYTLAGNVESTIPASKQTLVLTGASGALDTMISVGQEDIAYGGLYYKLEKTSASDLVLTVSKVVQVLNVGGEYRDSFDTVNAAFDAAATGETVRICSDASIAANFTVTDKTVTLDFNGYDISGADKTATVASGSTINLKNAGTITSILGVNGKIVSAGTTTQITNAGTVTGSGTVEITDDGVFVNAGTVSSTGTVKITNGTFTNTGIFGVANLTNAETGTFTSTAAITVTGTLDNSGTFTYTKAEIGKAVGTLSVEIGVNELSLTGSGTALTVLTVIGAIANTPVVIAKGWNAGSYANKITYGGKDYTWDEDLFIYSNADTTTIFALYEDPEVNYTMFNLVALTYSTDDVYIGMEADEMDPGTVITVEGASYIVGINAFATGTAVTQKMKDKATVLHVSDNTQVGTDAAVLSKVNTLSVESGTAVAATDINTVDSVITLQADSSNDSSTVKVSSDVTLKGSAAGSIDTNKILHIDNAGTISDITLNAAFHAEINGAGTATGVTLNAPQLFMGGADVELVGGSILTNGNIIYLQYATGQNYFDGISTTGAKLALKGNLNVDSVIDGVYLDPSGNVKYAGDVTMTGGTQTYGVDSGIHANSITVAKETEVKLNTTNVLFNTLTVTGKLYVDLKGLNSFTEGGSIGGAGKIISTSTGEWIVNGSVYYNFLNVSAFTGDFSMSQSNAETTFGISSASVTPALETKDSYFKDGVVVNIDGTKNQAVNLKGEDFTTGIVFKGDGNLNIFENQTLTGDNSGFTGYVDISDNMTVTFKGTVADTLNLNGAAATVVLTDDLTNTGSIDVNAKTSAADGSLDTLTANKNSVKLLAGTFTTVTSTSGDIDLTEYTTGTLDTLTTDTGVIYLASDNNITVSTTLDGAMTYDVKAAQGATEAADMTFTGTGTLDYTDKIIVNTTKGDYFKGGYELLKTDNGLTVSSATTTPWTLTLNIGSGTSIKSAEIEVENGKVIDGKLYVLYIDYDKVLILNQLTDSNFVAVNESWTADPYAVVSDEGKRRFIGYDAAMNIDNAIIYIRADESGKDAGKGTIELAVSDRNYAVTTKLGTAENGVTDMELRGRATKTGTKVEGNIDAGLATTLTLTNISLAGNVYGAGKVTINNTSLNRVSGTYIYANGKLAITGGLYTTRYVAGGYASSALADAGATSVTIKGIANERTTFSGTIYGGYIADGVTVAQTGNTSVTIDATQKVNLSANIYAGGAAINSGKLTVSGGKRTVTFKGDGANLGFLGTVYGGAYGVTGLDASKASLVFDNFSGRFDGAIANFGHVVISGNSSVSFRRVQGKVSSTKLDFKVNSETTTANAMFTLRDSSVWEFYETVAITVNHVNAGTYTIIGNLDSVKDLIFTINETVVGMGDEIVVGDATYTLNFAESSKLLTMEVVTTTANVMLGNTLNPLPTGATAFNVYDLDGLTNSTGAIGLMNSDVSTLSLKLDDAAATFGTAQQIAGAGTAETEDDVWAMAKVVDGKTIFAWATTEDGVDAALTAYGTTTFGDAVIKVGDATTFETKTNEEFKDWKSGNKLA